MAIGFRPVGPRKPFARRRCPMTRTFTSSEQIMSSSFARRRSGRATVRAAFTLIEILVVIVVIAILATLVAPNVFQHVSTAKTSTAKSQIEMLSTALDAYRLAKGHAPTAHDGRQGPV